MAAACAAALLAGCSGPLPEERPTGEAPPDPSSEEEHERVPEIDGAIVEDPDTEVQRVVPASGSTQVVAAGSVELELDGESVRFEMGLDIEVGWLELDHADVLGRVAVLRIVDDVEVMLFVPDAIALPEEPFAELLDDDSDPAEVFGEVADTSALYTVAEVEHATTGDGGRLAYLQLDGITDDHVPLFLVRARDDPGTAASLFIEPNPDPRHAGHVWVGQVADRWVAMIAGVSGDDAGPLDDAMRSLRPGN